LYLPETLKLQSKSKPKFSLAGIIKGYTDTIRNPAFVKVAFLSSLLVASLWVYIGNAPFVFSKMGIGPAAFGIYYGISVVGYVLGSIVNGILGGKISIDKMLSAGFFIIFVSSSYFVYLAHLHPFSPMTITLSVAVYFFGTALIFPITNTLAMTAGQRTGTSASLLNGLELVVSSCSIMLVGDKTNINFIAVSLFCFLTFVIGFAIYRLGVSRKLKI